MGTDADDFTDVKSISEQSLRKLWLNKGDDIWNQYIKNEMIK